MRGDISVKWLTMVSKNSFRSDRFGKEVGAMVRIEEIVQP